MYKVFLYLFIPCVIASEAILSRSGSGATTLALVIIVHILCCIKLSSTVALNATVKSLLLLLIFVLFQGIYLELDIIRYFQPVTLIILYVLFILTIYKYGVNVKFPRYLVWLIVLAYPLFLFPIETMGSNRLVGLFGNPNRTAFMSLFIFPFILFLKPSKIIRFISYFFFIIVLLLTASRGVFLAFLLGTITQALALKINKGFYFKSLVLLVTVFVCSLFIVDIASYLLELSGIVSDSRLFSTTYNGRDILKEMALDEFYKHPIIGNGFSVGTYELDNGIILKSHNGYMDILSRLGLIGLVLSILFVLSLIYDISKIFNRYNRSIALMVMAILLSITTNDSVFLSVNYFFFMSLYVIFLCFTKTNKI